MLDSVNPYTSEIIGEFQELSIEELDKRLNRSRLGFTSWNQLSISNRSQFLLNLAAILKKKKHEYASLISREMGKVIRESKIEIERSILVLEYFAENGEKYLKETLEKTRQGEELYVYQPVGVVLAIMSWNYPFWHFFRFAATSLMAGNSILLKHSSQVPACSEKIEEIFEEACFPGGVLQNLITPSSNIGRIIKDFRIQGVNFIGSMDTGAEIAEQAGRHIKKSVIELGGNDPFIVLPDADIKKAARAGARSRMKNFGQSCDAAKRFILHEKIADEFLSELKDEISSLNFGDPLDEISDYATLVSKKQKDLLARQVKYSIEKGAFIFWKDSKAQEEEAFYNPSILRNIRSGSPAYNEELFGPVTSVFEVEDGFEAVRIANDTDFGLGASIWSEDLERAQKLAYEIHASTIYLNREVISQPELPFRGFKKSGWGHEMEAEGLREFTCKKSIWYTLK